MFRTMYAAPGVGLAAPQIGVTRRIIVVDVAGKDEKPQPIALVNPEVVWRSDETLVYEEGCLSLPELYADVERPAAVQVRYLDRDGASREVEGEGVLGVCLQHEIDHLDGVLLIDRISALKRNIMLMKMVKAKQQRSR